ncbi:MAG: aminotransferase class IV [Flavobacteriaceae bacterium]|nr:aminotransferase class IV [Flavobacteriaceae bacterium]
MFPIVNVNGKLVDKSTPVFSLDHAAVHRGEVIQEKIRFFNGRFLFQEKHYFHLMANMRMARMDIPISFTPDFFYSEIVKLQSESGLENAVVYFNVSQNFDQTDFWVTAAALPENWHFNSLFQIDQYRETHMPSGFHHRIHFTIPQERILMKFAQENDLNDLILLNESKSIARSIYGNFFVIHGNKIATPKLENGAKDDVLRTVTLAAASHAPYFDTVIEEEIFPFSLVKADEIFIARDGFGIISVSNFKKQNYSTEITSQLIDFVEEL